jgi:FkbM family methyltransferase
MSVVNSSAIDPKAPERLLGRPTATRLRQAIKSNRCYWRLKVFLKRISGREIWVRPELRVPTRSGDGWDYIATRLRPGAIVYAFGVGDTIEFESRLIANHGVIVHAFDPTPYALAWIETQKLPNGLHFHPWAVAGTDGTLKLYPRLLKKRRRTQTMWTIDPHQADAASAIDVPAFTIASAMRSLGHDRIDLLKLDVEGAEYDAIAAMLVEAVAPRQLLIEFHHRFPGIGTQRTRACLRALRGAGYRIFAVSRTGRELSLIRSVTEPHELRPS